MSSQLNQLKQSMRNMADTAMKTGSSVAQYEKQFNKQRQEVQNLIGGSSQGKDREIQQALARASKAVKDATSALQEAAKAAQKYAQSI